jgi:2-keto-4-pentenoate hydratase/2-oxohepta-3-ene-1,7-dioic acid hydratase in catechol pathway
MKLASYIADGKHCFGAVAGDGVVTLNERLGGRYGSLREALAAGLLAEMRGCADGAKPDHKLGEVAWLPAIPNPEKILCAGINYRSHAAETGRELPKQPSMFIRLANTLTGHEGEMIRPSVSQSFDFEGELAVVIGKGGRHIPEANAFDHVAGYTCFVDGSVRDYQKFSVTSGEFPARPARPWIVTTDEIADPPRLTLATRLNGQEVQRSGTDLLIYSVPQIIAFCSDFTPLAPGDVIATGTPEGVGHRRSPPLWMKPGDVLEVEISGIGTLRNRVVDEVARRSGLRAAAAILAVTLLPRVTRHERSSNHFTYSSV